MKEEIDRCNLCGKELKEEDGEFIGDYEFVTEKPRQYFRLCKECRRRFRDPSDISNGKTKYELTRLAFRR